MTWPTNLFSGRLPFFTKLQNNPPRKVNACSALCGPSYYQLLAKLAKLTNMGGYWSYTCLARVSEMILIWRMNYVQSEPILGYLELGHFLAAT